MVGHGCTGHPMLLIHVNGIMDWAWMHWLPYVTVCSWNTNLPPNPAPEMAETTGNARQTMYRLPPTSRCHKFTACIAQRWIYTARLLKQSEAGGDISITFLTVTRPVEEALQTMVSMGFEEHQALSLVNDDCHKCGCSTSGVLCPARRRAEPQKVPHGFVTFV